MGGGVLKAFHVKGSSPALRTTLYNTFLGVDFSTDPMLVGRSRSPFALNLIADSRGMPCRRVGWRELMRLEGRIHGLYHLSLAGSDCFICHAGTNILRIFPDGAGESILLAEGADDRPGPVFCMEEKIYFITGGRYFCYDGSTVADVEGYVPLLTTNNPPEGGGVTVEAENLLGPRGTDEFIGNGSTKTFQLSRSGLDEAEVVCEVYSTASQKWTRLEEEGLSSVDREAGTVTFTSAPSSSQFPNVRITYSKTTPGSREKLLASKTCTLFDGAVFLCGGVKGQDFHSGYGRPDYFPADGYDCVGSDEYDIVGYCRIGDSLGILKEYADRDSTIYLRTRDTVKDALGVERAVYTRKAGIAGVGALAAQSIGRLLDDPVFLSHRGVMGIGSNAVTYEKTVVNRSVLVNSRLTAEPGLEEACMTQWGDKLLVCVNSHCYVLDGGRRSFPNGSSGGFVYECFYWENIPAVCFLTRKDDLYFGTADGRICRFNTDIADDSRYSDNGEAIPVEWRTCLDDEGYPTRTKSIIRRGFFVTLQPHSDDGVEVCICTDTIPTPKVIGRLRIRILNWSRVDFGFFPFLGAKHVQDLSVGGGVRDYRQIQLIVRSSSVNKSFGMLRIVKTFRLGGIPR